jgi:hypothetical protein
MKRTILPKDQQSCRMLSVRTDLIKLACRAATSARRTVFKLCSSSPFKELFSQAMRRIKLLQFA